MDFVLHGNVARKSFLGLTIFDVFLVAGLQIRFCYAGRIQHGGLGAQGFNCVGNVFALAHTTEPHIHPHTPPHGSPHRAAHMHPHTHTHGSHHRATPTYTHISPTWFAQPNRTHTRPHTPTYAHAWFALNQRMVQPNYIGSGVRMWFNGGALKNLPGAFV